MADHTCKRIVSQCDVCCLPDVMTGECTAFVDPSYQWRGHDCWGVCKSSEEMIERLLAVYDYAKAYGSASMAKGIERELARWKADGKRDRDREKSSKRNTRFSERFFSPKSGNHPGPKNPAPVDMRTYSEAGPIIPLPKKPDPIIIEVVGLNKGR